MENNNKNEIEDFEKMISNKTKNFFEKNVKLTKDTLPQYLEYIGLINFWNMLLNFIRISVIIP